MSSLPQIFAAALRHYENGTLEEAEAQARAVLARAPGFADAIGLLGLIARRRNDPARGADLLRRALALSPEHGPGWLRLSRSLQDLGAAEKAEEACGRAVVLIPGSVDAWTTLGLLRQIAGRDDEALPAFEQALALQPGHVEALFYAAGQMTLRSRFPEAVALYRRAVANRPDLCDLYVNLGTILFRSHALDAVEAVYRRALQLRPEWAAAYQLLGQYFLTQGRPDDAAAFFRAALAFSPSDADLQAALERSRSQAVAIRAAGGAGHPSGLVIRGAFRDTSGYAQMVRNFTQCLHDGGRAIHLIDINVAGTPSLAPRQRAPLFERLDRPVRAETVLNFTIPTRLEAMPPLKSVLFSMFEGRRIPSEWVPFSRTQDLLIVPTESSRQAWCAAGLPEDRIRLCPLGVEAVPDRHRIPTVHIVDRRGRRLADYRTRILNISDFFYRKNLDGLLRVWFRATGPDDDAALVVKPGKGFHPGDPTFARFAEHVARSLGKSVDDAAPVFIIPGRYTDQEMLSLFVSTTHYWSMSHAEGWDLPMTQAGALGLRLIAPDHSAYRAYLDPSIASLIPARESQAVDSLGRVPLASYYPPLWMSREQDWWDPDEDAAAHILRAVVEGREAPLSARDRLVSNYSWPKAAGRLASILRDAGLLADAAAG